MAYDAAVVWIKVRARRRPGDLHALALERAGAMEQNLPASNEILKCMPKEAFEVLRPNLAAVDLPARMQLERAHQPIKYAYFPFSGMASVVAHGSGGRPTEIALIGREGMTALPLVLGTDRSPHETFMQSAGHGLRITADLLLTAIQSVSVLHDCLLLFCHVCQVQTAQTCWSNAQNTVAERLARWLLMAHDRSQTDQLHLTHEFLSHMLGVRRPGISVALKELQDRGVVVAKRGAIEIVDREALEDTTNGAYGVPEAEFKRLFGR